MANSFTREIKIKTVMSYHCRYVCNLKKPNSQKQQNGGCRGLEHGRNEEMLIKIYRLPVIRRIGSSHCGFAVSMRKWDTLALLSGQGSGLAMNCGVGFRRASDPMLLWLWFRPAATPPIQPPAWEPPYAAGTALKKIK